jgi:hypothetical protein
MAGEARRIVVVLVREMGKGTGVIGFRPRIGLGAMASKALVRPNIGLFDHRRRSATGPGNGGKSGAGGGIRR